MVEDKALSSVLSEFARTVITDFPIQGILDHLVGRITELLPVTGCGVTLISAEKAPHYVAASDASALLYEQLQSELGHGPCLLAFESGVAVVVPDLSTDDRFPGFTTVALAAGLKAVFALPLRHGNEQLGALDLYSDTAGELSSSDMVVAQTLADVTAAYLLNARSRDAARDASDFFQHSALHDPLTGLPNRALLNERLQHASDRARRSHTSAAILFADLDRFKEVNDFYGHRTGDELLIAVAGRLYGLVRPGDTLARVSGDEFVILCEELQGSADADLLASRICLAFTTPFSLTDSEITLTASVGVAFAGPGEAVSEALVVKADMAMYEAKRSGGASHRTVTSAEAFASHSTHVDRRDDRHDLATELRTAFLRNELHLAYQPIVRVDDGLITGVEALLRWTHPERGPIAASEMVGAAEQSGLINDIGAWVLERSCRDHRRWSDLNADWPLDLAVNVSARQLVSDDFCSTLSKVLTETAIDPSLLVLEVTESLFIEDSDVAIRLLDRVKQLGVRLAIDDFGTGYSSLSYLRRMPVDTLKIDQSFIGAIHEPKGRAVVAAIVQVAKILGFGVTAEGIESRTQHDAIESIGCDLAQGFYYAEPLSASGIESLLRAL